MDISEMESSSSRRTGPTIVANHRRITSNAMPVSKWQRKKCDPQSISIADIGIFSAVESLISHLNTVAICCLENAREVV